MARTVEGAAGSRTVAVVRRRAGIGLAPAAALLALTLGGCGAVKDLVGGGGDPAEKPAELHDITPEITVDTLWERKVGAGARKQYLKLRPTVSGGRVFAAGRRGEVSAYSAENGERLWTADLDVPIGGGPGAGEGLVLVGTIDGEVLALGEEDGALHWRSRVTSEVLSPPVASQGIVVARTIDGKLFGLSVADGSRVWVYDRTVPILTLRGTSTPVVASGTVVAGFDSGRLVAVSLANGQPFWEIQVAVPSGRSELERMVDIDGDPVVRDDTVYVVSFHGRISAIDLATGEVVWRREMSSHTGVGADQSNLYVTDDQSHIWALDRSNSASLWRQKDLQARAVTSPLAFGSYVVVGDGEGYVHFLHVDDGRFVARVRVDNDGIIAAPVSDGRTVFVYDRDGRLTALVPH